MGDGSKIEWTDHTFNPWWGCVKVSPACEHCYAERLARRFGTGWGVGTRRLFFEDGHWGDPVRWNRKAAGEGVRRRVFCASMADWLEKLPEDHSDRDAMGEARLRLYELIEETPALDWLLLTKRPENFGELAPNAWLRECPPNAWVGATVEDQRRADERIPVLLKIPASVLFLSCEPLLGPVDLTQVEMRERHGVSYWLDALRAVRMAAGEDGAADVELPRSVGWVIAGGESGPGARPSHPEWFRGLLSDCADTRTPFFFKQWGDWGPAAPLLDGVETAMLPTGKAIQTASGPVAILQAMQRVGKKRAGRMLDGRAWDELPEPGRGGAGG